MTSDPEDIACRTKVSYPSQSQAKRHLKLLRKRGRRSLVLYRCRYCGQFHLGNPWGKQTYTRMGDPPIVPNPRTG